jgi:hypothetical protein
MLAWIFRRFRSRMVIVLLALAIGYILQMLRATSTWSWPPVGPRCSIGSISALRTAFSTSFSAFSVTQHPRPVGWLFRYDVTLLAHFAVIMPEHLYSGPLTLSRLFLNGTTHAQRSVQGDVPAL